MKSQHIDKIHEAIRILLLDYIDKNPGETVYVDDFVDSLATLIGENIDQVAEILDEDDMEIDPNSVKATPDKINFIPKAAERPWDDIEMNACIDLGDAIEAIHPDKNGNYETQPDFWSVYLHQVEGGVQCVADVPTQEHAIALGDLIRNAVRTYKNNGHLTMYSNDSLKKEINDYIDKEIDKLPVSSFTITELISVKKYINQLIW